MIHGFGKFWNIFSYFWIKLLDALLFSCVCHYTIVFATGKEDVFDISAPIFGVAFGLAFVFSIIHTVRIIIAENKNKEPRILNREPDAINVKNKRDSDINVKAHRVGMWFVRNGLLIIGGAAALLIAQQVGGYNAENERGSWLPAVVLAAECIFFNFYVCRKRSRCKCPKCWRWRAITLDHRDVLEKTRGDWTELSDRMDFDEVQVDMYREGIFGDQYIGSEMRKQPVIRTHSTEHHNVKLGKYRKHYLCRYCGQRFIYEDTEFNPSQPF